jgi:hypothetical protein
MELEKLTKELARNKRVGDNELTAREHDVKGHAWKQTTPQSQGGFQELINRR